MSLVSLSLVVLAAFIHATWNLLSKRAAVAGPTFVFAYNLVACVAYAPWVAWLLAQGARPMRSIGLPIKADGGNGGPFWLSDRQWPVLWE